MGNKVYLTSDQLDAVICNKDEQETTINWLRVEDKLVICTSDNTYITKMKKIMERDPESYKCYSYDDNVDENGNYYTYFFEVPKSLLTWRVQRDKRMLTDEQRQKLSERAKQNLVRKRINKGEE